MENDRTEMFERVYQINAEIEKLLKERTLILCDIQKELKLDWCGMVKAYSEFEIKRTTAITKY